ncbi:MAG: hypothetical protein H8E00_00565 [Deltaproteobacteria bacterium]|nr:hypothetical protein [Deltaproteobacteria bacterium]MBL7217963.1 hypothetical protein [Desulfobacteraceae bacterium]
MNMKYFLAKAFPVYLFLALVALLHCPFSFAYEEEIKDISANMARDIADAGKKTIAVADFTDLQGNVTELGRFLAEEFSVALAGAGTRFEVVDRIHLKSIIREHNLSATGMIDPKTARKLGKIAGVQALITGTVTPFGDNVRVTVKILDTETAKIIGASTANIAKTKAIEELLARGIETRSPYQQPASSQYRPPAGTNMTKKVGPLVITMKKIMISRGQVIVALGFFNGSDKGFKMGRQKSPYPSLTDEKGNVYKYRNGLEWEPDSYLRRKGLTLAPKLENDIILKFSYDDQINYDDIGSVFTFSLSFAVYSSKDKSISDYKVVFMDVKAQKPR